MAHLTADQHEDLDFLRQTMGWPMWPWCPVVRPRDGHEGPECASCFDGPNGKRVVYLANLHLLAEGLDLKTVEKIDYANSYEMLADGWRVD